MSYQLDLDTLLGDRHALCIGIGQYNKLLNRDLRFAVSDAQEVAKILQDPVRGNFQVTLLTDPSEVTRSSLEEILEQTFNSPNLKTEDLVLIYFSCHGGISGRGKHFYLLPSDARLDENGNPIKTTILTHYDLAKILEGTKVKNIIFILDACYSGGAAEAIQHLDLHLDLNPDISLFIIGAARHDQTAVQSSNVAHGLFTSCLLQAFEQKPRRNDGWITISEIHSFISDEIKKYDTSNIVQIQTTITAVNPNIVITKNPRYSLQSIDFYENVKKLLVLAQYVPVVQELEEAPPGFYIADLKAGIKFLRVGIISCYNKIEKVTVEEAKKFASFIKKQREKGNLDQGLIITLIELDNQVKTTIRSIGRFLEIKTYDDIWRELIDFQKYLLNISNKFENSVGSYEEVPLAQVYVPLNAETRLHDSETSISNALTTNKLKRLY